jgi:hypothetical protein
VGVRGCVAVCGNVRRRSELFWVDVRRCSEVFGRCSAVFGCFLCGCSEVFGGVRSCLGWVFGGVWCLEMFGGVQRCPGWVLVGCSEAFGVALRSCSSHWFVVILFRAPCWTVGRTFSFGLHSWPMRTQIRYPRMACQAVGAAGCGASQRGRRGEARCPYGAAPRGAQRHRNMETQRHRYT